MWYWLRKREKYEKEILLLTYSFSFYPWKSPEGKHGDIQTFVEKVVLELIGYRSMQGHGANLVKKIFLLGIVWSQPFNIEI